MGRKKIGRDVNCLECGKSFHLAPSRFGKRGKFCSRVCYFKFTHNAKEAHIERKKR